MNNTVPVKPWLNILSTTKQRCNQLEGDGVSVWCKEKKKPIKLFSWKLFEYKNNNAAVNVSAVNYVDRNWHIKYTYERQGGGYP